MGKAERTDSEVDMMHEPGWCIRCITKISRLQENTKAELVELHEPAFRISHALTQHAMLPVKSMCKTTQQKHQSYRLNTPVQVGEEIHYKLGCPLIHRNVR